MTLYLLVGALGLVVGFLAGIVFRDALDLYRSSRKERPMSPTRSHALNRWLLIIVLVVNGVVGSFLIYQRAESAEFTRCTAEWQGDFQSAYTARADANAASQEALDGILGAVYASDEEAFQKALGQYRELRADQVATRKAKPLPELPETVCGGESK